MNTKIISNRASEVIDQYAHFRFGSAVASIPYFNNKTVKARAALRTYIGKGSPKDLYEEMQTIAVKSHLVPDSLADEALKKILVENNLGIECSGFVYYVLNAESQERKTGDLSAKLSFPNCHGLIGKIRCSLRPAENCDVATFAHEKNSHPVAIKDALPGDIIAMTADAEEAVRDHILVIHQIEYQNFVPVKIHYSHAIAYPEDGIYGSGIRQGTITISDANKPIADQIWDENGKVGQANRLYVRAQKSVTTIRRMNWF